MPKVEHCFAFKSFNTLASGKANGFASVAELFLSRILFRESRTVKKSKPLKIFPFNICLVFFPEYGGFSSYIACEMHASKDQGVQDSASRVCYKH